MENETIISIDREATAYRAIVLVNFRDEVISSSCPWTEIEVTASLIEGHSGIDHMWTDAVSLDEIHGMRIDANYHRAGKARKKTLTYEAVMATVRRAANRHVHMTVGGMIAPDIKIEINDTGRCWREQDLPVLDALLSGDARRMVLETDRQRIIDAVTRVIDAAEASDVEIDEDGDIWTGAASRGWLDDDQIAAVLIEARECQ